MMGDALADAAECVNAGLGSASHHDQVGHATGEHLARIALDRTTGIPRRSGAPSRSPVSPTVIAVTEHPSRAPISCADSSARSDAGDPSTPTEIDCDPAGARLCAWRTASNDSPLPSIPHITRSKSREDGGTAEPSLCTDFADRATQDPSSLVRVASCSLGCSAPRVVLADQPAPRTALDEAPHS